jgi:hypothetical protein
MKKNIERPFYNFVKKAEDLGRRRLGKFCPKLNQRRKTSRRNKKR